MSLQHAQTDRPGEDLASLRRQFDLLDTDEDGHISPLHLTNVLRSIDLHITDKEMTDVMAKTDVDGDGLITFEDFRSALARARREEQQLSAHERDQALRKTFQIFDRKNLGTIGPKDILAVLRNMGKDFSLDEIEEMVDEVDEDGKSRITYPEFVQLVMREE